jgi:putative colanic acid biosynthesis acetyltransferase WcaF
VNQPATQPDAPRVQTVVAAPRRRIFRAQSRKEKVASFLWRLVRVTLFRWSPAGANAWRVLLLRCFGGRIGRSVSIHPTARINFPWNLTVGGHAHLLHEVVIDSQARVTIGDGSRISQFSHLCTATHSYNQRTMPIVGQPIVIGKGCWLAADVFVGSGVTVGDGSVLGARCSVFRDVPAGVVVAGTPARVIRRKTDPPGPVDGESHD